jgi:hypothetical protein
MVDTSGLPLIQHLVYFTIPKIIGLHQQIKWYSTLKIAWLGGGWAFRIVNLVYICAMTVCLYRNKTPQYTVHTVHTVLSIIGSIAIMHDNCAIQEGGSHGIITIMPGNNAMTLIMH